MALPAKLQADVNFRRGLAAAAGVSVLALAAIVIFLLSQALPIFAHVSLKDFLFSTEWYPTDDPPVFGIGALIAGSLACAVRCSDSLRYSCRHASGAHPHCEAAD